MFILPAKLKPKILPHDHFKFFDKQIQEVQHRMSKYIKFGIKIKVMTFVTLFLVIWITYTLEVPSQH